MCLGSTAPDATSMGVWVEGNTLVVQGVSIPGLLKAVYQYQYPNAWNRLQKMWLRYAFTRFYDQVQDEKMRVELRMVFALLRTHVAERKAWARERRGLLVEGVRKHGMRLLRASFTALRLSASAQVWAPALRKLWAPARYKRCLRSWNNSLVCVMFTHWRQRIQRHLAWKRSCVKCAKDAEIWVRDALAIYFKRQQQVALTRYHTCRQERRVCFVEHVPCASSVKRN